MDGKVTVSDTYATTDAVNDALQAIRSMPEPWFTWVAFNAPHDPYHRPPDALLRGELSADPTRHELYRAMIGALDKEIGRLLDAMAPAVRARTLVVVVGDNGTPGQVIPPPFHGLKGKHTTWEGGVNVPFIVSGAGVTGRGKSKALVHVVDLFPTVAELAGVNPRAPTKGGAPAALDGRSLVPLLADPDAPWNRDVLFTELFRPVGSKGPYTEEQVAVRDKRFKYMELREQGHDTERYLFDLRGRVDDGPNLLDGPLDEAAAEAKARLVAELARFEAIGSSPDGAR